MEKLEQMKLGATQSQIAIINEQIRQLQEKFHKELAQIDFQTDESGRRFYYDESGEKKFLDDVNVQMDDIGDYTLDAAGNKVYAQEYAEDEFGRYYLNENDDRIYKATPHSAECRVIGGVLMKIKQNPDQAHDHHDDSDRWIPFSEHINGENQDLDFIIKEFGTPLKLGLAEVILQQPDQPLELLVNYLKHYKRVKALEKQEEIEDQVLNAARKKAARMIFDEQIKVKRNAQKR